MQYKLYCFVPRCPQSYCTTQPLFCLHRHHHCISSPPKPPPGIPKTHNPFQNTHPFQNTLPTTEEPSSRKQYTTQNDHLRHHTCATTAASFCPRHAEHGETILNSKLSSRKQHTTQNGHLRHHSSLVLPMAY